MAYKSMLMILVFAAIGQDYIMGIKFGRNKVEVIHRGKQLQDLVMLDSRVAPHDLDNLHAFVRPKLLEDSKDEGLMLQENGIEDFRPLDVTIETDEGPHKEKKHHKEKDQMLVSHTGDNDEGYNLQDMPEYKMETKADFEENQEAIDWLMKDPNEYNAKSFEDSDALEDTNNFGLDMDFPNMEDQHRTNFRQRKKGKERHNDMSGKGTIKLPGNPQFLQDSDHIGDDTDLLSSEMDAETGIHRAKLTKSTDSDKNFQNSEYSENDNLDHSYKTWNDNNNDVNDGTTDRWFDEYDSDKDASSRKSLQERIKNQDAKLFQEIDNYNKGDNYETSDYMDNFDNYGDELKNTIDPENKDMADDKSDDEEDTARANDGNSDRYQDDDAPENKYAWNSEESPHVGDKTDTEKLEDTDNGENSDASGILSGDTNDSLHGKMEDEITENAKATNTNQQVKNRNSHNVNGNSKVQEAEGEVTNNRSNNTVIQTTQSIGDGEENHLGRSKDVKIINKGQHTQAVNYKENEMPANNKFLHQTTTNSSSGKDHHSKTVNPEEDKIGTTAKSLWIPAKSEIKGFQHSNSSEQVVSLSDPEVIGEIKKGSKTEQSHEESQSQTKKLKSKQSDEQWLILQKVNDLLREAEESPHTQISAALTKPKLDHRKEFPHHNSRTRSQRKSNKPTSTGFRRNWENYRPSPPRGYSTPDLKKMEQVISFLRGTTSSLSLPTRSSRPSDVSLKSLYYYPLHPTPQDQNDGTSADTKDATFGEWNDWSSCSVTCGKGVTVRARVCLVNACPQKDLFQSKSCHEDICADEVEKEALKEHNRLRAKHFSPPLSWSASLARKARKIAQSLAGKDFLTLDDLQERQGESIAQIVYTGESTIAKAIDKWYKEIGSYSFSYPKINSKTRHFAQITWKGTKKMGLAITRSGSGEYAFVVALYNPPVSSERHLQQNILPPGLRHDLYSTFR